MGRQDWLRQSNRWLLKGSTVMSHFHKIVHSCESGHGAEAETTAVTTQARGERFPRGAPPESEPLGLAPDCASPSGRQPGATEPGQRGRRAGRVAIPVVT